MDEAAADTPSEKSGIDRRAAIKKGVIGSAIVGVAWSAPKVEGLSLRPDYASAASGPGTFTLTFNAYGNLPGPAGDCGGGTYATANLQMSAINGQFASFQMNTAGGAVIQFNAVNTSPAAAYDNIPIGNAGGNGDFIAFAANPVPLPLTFTVSYDCT